MNTFAVVVPARTSAARPRLPATKARSIESAPTIAPSMIRWTVTGTTILPAVVITASTRVSHSPRATSGVSDRPRRIVAMVPSSA
jgi:hypothetical protein